MDGQDPFFK
jgi:hypothetical protein